MNSVHYPKYLKIAQKLAMEHKYDERLTFKHCSLVVLGGRILSVGFNYLHDKDLRFDPKLAIRAHRFQSENHAEIDAIFGIKKTCSHQLRHVKLYVVRVNSSGKLANSKPCELCASAIKTFGIPRVIYSTSDDSYGTWLPGMAA